MSQEREAKYDRRAHRERMKNAQPLKMIPSKKGLLTIYLFCAACGWATGLIAELVRRHAQ